MGHDVEKDGPTGLLGSSPKALPCPCRRAPSVATALRRMENCGQHTTAGGVQVEDGFGMRAQRATAANGEGKMKISTGWGRLAFLLCVFLAFAGGMAAHNASAAGIVPPSIASDQEDYAPGSLVTLTGSDWAAGEKVHIYVNDNGGQTWERNADVTANVTGQIMDQFLLPDWFVATYAVTATGSLSGTATPTFTDGTVRVRLAGSGVVNPSTATVAHARYTSDNTCTGTPPVSQTGTVQTNDTAFTNIGSVNIDGTQ